MAGATKVSTGMIRRKGMECSSGPMEEGMKGAGWMASKKERESIGGRGRRTGGKVCGKRGKESSGWGVEAKIARWNAGMWVGMRRNE